MSIHKEINVNFFKKWSREMAYILGFMFADGNVVRNKRGSYYFSIYTSDKDLLLAISKAMNSKYKVSKRAISCGNVYRTQVGIKEMSLSLIKLGLTENKSRRMKLPKIPKKYIGDFIRGYFDGDGNVWLGEIHKNRQKTGWAIQTSFTCGSDLFLKDLFIHLKLLGIKGGSYIRVKNCNCSRICLSTNDSLKIYKIMYNRPHELFLDRKRRVFEKFIKMRA